MSKCRHRWYILNWFTKEQFIYKEVYFLSLLFLQYIKISGKSINFDNKKIKKSEFYKNKKLLKIEDIDVNKIFVSKKESYGTKNAI